MLNSGGFCLSRLRGPIPVALNNSEGAGSVRIVVRLPGAHLYMQVLGNLRTPTVCAVPPLLGIMAEKLPFIKRDGGSLVLGVEFRLMDDCYESRVLNAAPPTNDRFNEPIPPFTASEV